LFVVDDRVFGTGTVNGMDRLGHLMGLIERGDVFYNLQGTGRDEILGTMVRVVRTPSPLDKDALVKALVEREGIVTTAIGNGIAIPHPRRSFVNEEKASFIAVGYPGHPIVWGAEDGKPVTALFLILSSDTDQHLRPLSSIACLSSNRKFMEFLATQPSKSELLAFLGSCACCR